MENLHDNGYAGYIPLPTNVNKNSPGRPNYYISQEQLIYLRTSGLNISPKSLQRQRSLMQFVGPHISITRDELLVLIRDILSSTPNAGEVYIIAAIRARNINVSRWRQTHTIRRREYKVNGLNYLWHTDSNHKLTILCSWLGHRGNFAIKNLQTTIVIKDIILGEYADFKEKDIESSVSEWFRLAKLRLRRENEN
ncbi:hypothetical protein RN001_002810 [Aquatica leii]|uniref:Uncharacterized protein n=1 Tax=Aquatica leii TaxID=1421715 RepID=A0AAN7PHD9_9COLE|nr:hypothetical protein RN001_002810 [Aquatica leii]